MNYKTKRAIIGVAVAFIASNAMATPTPERTNADIAADYLFAVDEANATRDYRHLVEITEDLPCQQRIKLFKLGKTRLKPTRIYVGGVWMNKVNDGLIVLDKAIKDVSKTCKGGTKNGSGKTK